ncbi:MAG: hypothetical protein KBF74_04230 [Ferruginibacter sp.]|nr:hypothetical protein [Ferruginibacter sp.]
MKKTFILVLSLFSIGLSLQAQYYYRDIISNKQLLAEMAIYKENKIRSIKIKSFEDDGTESDGFFCEKKISKDYRKTELFTRSNISGISLFISLFNDKGQLLSTSDSSEIAVSVNKYSYDKDGRLSSILSIIKSSDDDFTNEIQEEHIYYYNSINLPEKMIRVKNKYDSIAIFFALDENNNLGIEKDSKNGFKYYYYYDNKNRITDIVHSNDATTKLLPDYLFEYNNAGQLVQMTNTEEGGSNYFVWKYSYDNGLRNREKCYSKERKLMGSIEYEYN